jgi:hypothetical protein
MTRHRLNSANATDVSFFPSLFGPVVGVFKLLRHSATVGLVS